MDLNLNDPAVIEQLKATDVMSGSQQLPTAPSEINAQPARPKTQEAPQAPKKANETIRLTVSAQDVERLERDAKQIGLTWKEYFRFLVSERITGRPIGSQPLVTGPSGFGGSGGRVSGPSNWSRR